MEQKLKLGFVGTHVRMGLIREIVPEAFPEIQAVIYENDRHDYSEEMARDLVRLKARVDGIIFGGELQFNLYHSLIQPDIPCSYIEKDSASLLNSFFALSWRKVDITRVSVDNYSPSTVQKILSDAGVPENHVVVLRRRFVGTIEKYYEDLYDKHRELYLEGKVSGCITTLFFVRDRLAADGIPVAYSRPTTDNITQTVVRMKRLCLEHMHRTEGDFAVLNLHIIPKEEIYYQFQPEYLMSREKLKALEELYYFARDMRATVIPQSDELFILLMSRNDLLHYSNSLENMPFLQVIRDNCKCNVDLGIGFGRTIGEARSNAGLALKRAAQSEGSCTYIVHNINSIAGPIHFSSRQSQWNDEEQEAIQELVKLTGISASKLYRINLLKAQRKKSLFTSAELAEQLNLSVRGTNRLLAVMEEHNLARLAGQTATGKAGRPRNIYQILLDLE